ncbi:MAG: transposase zinc-binding domain-containing protein [Leptospiraceae bacterium]|nr:transposase zinc-binding domain-containing protein [Leptospiraceae bacterium]
MYICSVQKLLNCGNFLNGFQRYTCMDCGTTLVVPFTCKSRLCLSCNRKKLFSWSSNSSFILNTDFNHIHVTFTIPGTLSEILFQKGYIVDDMIEINSSQQPICHLLNGNQRYLQMRNHVCSTALVGVLAT